MKIDKIQIVTAIILIAVGVVGGMLYLSMPMNVSNISYVAEGDANVVSDGVTYDISLLHNEEIVFESPGMFSGHSCITCPVGKLPMSTPRSVNIDPMIKADTLIVTAHDVESNYQYIQINDKRFIIPTGPDQAAITYVFDLRTGSVVKALPLTVSNIRD